MTLEETIYISSLYNIYGKLLTDKQQQIFENYVFENLSLAEVAENVGISRQAVLDCVNKCCNILNKYEESLGICKSNEKVKEILLEAKQNLTNEKLIKKINDLLTNI